MGTEAFDIAHDAGRLANQVPRRRSSRPARRPANGTTVSSCLGPSHYGEAGAAHASQPRLPPSPLAGLSPHPLMEFSSPHQMHPSSILSTTEFSSPLSKFLRTQPPALRLLKHRTVGGRRSRPERR